MCSCSALVFVAIPLYKCQIYLSMLPLVNIWVVLTVTTMLLRAILVCMAWCCVHVFLQGLYLTVELLGQRMHISSPLLDALANDFPSGCLPLAFSLLHDCSSYAEGRKPHVQNCWSQAMLEEGERLWEINLYAPLFLSMSRLWGLSTVASLSQPLLWQLPPKVWTY